MVISKIGTTKGDSCDKMRQKTVIIKSLESATEVYYKVRQVLQSVTLL